MGGPAPRGGRGSPRAAVDGPRQRASPGLGEDSGGKGTRVGRVRPRVPADGPRMRLTTVPDGMAPSGLTTPVQARCPSPRESDQVQGNPESKGDAGQGASDDRLAFPSRRSRVRPPSSALSKPLLTRGFRRSGAGRCQPRLRRPRPCRDRAGTSETVPGTVPECGSASAGPRARVLARRGGQHPNDWFIACRST